MHTILFICTANRFRSPLAAAYFARLLAQHGHAAEFTAASAGTWAGAGHPATPEARAIATEQGLDLSTHRTRPVTADLLSEAVLVLVMESNQQEALRQEFPQAAARVHTLAHAAGLDSFDVPDPYTTSESPGVVAREIMAMIDQGYEKIITLARDRAETA